MNKQNRGKFIVFEGIDGSGKSTQVRMLTDRLNSINIDSYTTMEPTDSPIGSMIHQIMIGRMKTDNKVIASLFVADRLDHLLNDVNGILKKIDDGITVVSDRYYFSSYAYHSVDMPMDWVIQANSQSSELLKPTVTIFIDIDPDVAIDRISKNRSQMELFEKKSRLVEVRNKYFEAFDKLRDDENILIIDGDKDPEAVSKDVWKYVHKYF